MAASESTKFQVNFKTSDGTLINLYATNKDELEGLLTAASDFSALIISTGKSLGSSAPTAPVYNSAPAAVVAAVSSGEGQSVVDRYGNTWVYDHPNAPECARGRMILKHGKAQSTGKPYKGWFDPASGPNWSGIKIPKDQQAATIWA